MGGGILRIIAIESAVNGIVVGAAAALEDDAEDAEEETPAGGNIVRIARVVVDAGVVEL